MKFKTIISRGLILLGCLCLLSCGKAPRPGKPLAHNKEQALTVAKDALKRMLPAEADAEPLHVLEAEDCFVVFYPPKDGGDMKIGAPLIEILILKTRPQVSVSFKGITLDRLEEIKKTDYSSLKWTGGKS
jgi:hypothetical protein